MSNNEPNTHKGDAPADLVGLLVNVRPYYHVPSSSCSLTPARSPWTCEASVIEAHSEMIVVEFTWETDYAPWKRKQLFHPSELHRAYRECECPACMMSGDGLSELHGA